MTAKQKKLFLLTSMMSVFVMAAAVLFAGGKFSLSPLGVRGGEAIEGSITWTRDNSQQTQHTYNKYSFYRTTARGTGMYLYSYGAGSQGASGSKLWSSKASSSNSYGLFVSTTAGSGDSLFEFQSITSVSFVTTGSDTNATFYIYNGGTDTTPVATKTITSPGETITFTPSTKMTKLSVNTTLDNKWVEFTSITVNYSCSPDGTPAKLLSSISVSGQTSEFAIGDEFEFGGTVTAHYDDSTTEDVTSSSTFTGYNMLSLGVQTVTVSYSNKTTTYNIEVVSGVLDSISLSGQTTTYSVNDTFSFDGIVTAVYQNGYEDTVTPTSVTSPDMTTTGEKSVTVSYTESGITKTANYTITVVSQPVGPFTFAGVYNYASRGLTVTGNSSSATVKDWTGCMSIEFKNDGSCVWLNEYKPTGSIYTFKCVVNFTYIATFDGSKSTIVMTYTSYDFKRKINSGNYDTYDYASAWNYNVSNYDRPINDGYGVTTATNNTGVLSADRSTLSIGTFIREKNAQDVYVYNPYDTLTFNLAS